MVEHSPEALRNQQRLSLWVSLGANAAFMVVEIVGGLAFHSLALLADAAHMLSDVAALAVALIAQSLLGRPASAKHTYGLQRAEVLGAQVNGLTLVVVAAWIIYEAFRRFSAPQHVIGRGLLVVAVLGFAVNLGSAILLRRSQGKSLNMRGAFLHMAFDSLGSIGVIASGVAVVVWGATWVDPAVSIMIGILVLWSAWGLLRETAQVLLEGTPRGMSVAAVERELEGAPGVESIHHLHLWNLASDTPALSAHVVMSQENLTLHDAQQSSDRLKSLLAERFAIDHATLDLECHACDNSNERGRSYDHA